MGRDRHVGRMRVLALMMLAAALGLTGCGRKSALDAPPSAQAVPTPAEQPQPGWRSPSGIMPELSGQNQSSQQTLPPARNRTFVLDPLLR
jgi:predicted small lipoprotein YifL